MIFRTQIESWNRRDSIIANLKRNGVTDIEVNEVLELDSYEIFLTYSMMRLLHRQDHKTAFKEAILRNPTILLNDADTLDVVKGYK